MYEGSPKPADQVSIMHIDPHVLVLRIDDKQEDFAGGGRKVLAHSAGIRRESIALIPGIHTIEAQFGVLCLKSENTKELTINAEPGKQYRLKSEIIDHKLWYASIVEYGGEEVSDPVELAKVMCPVRVNLIRLPVR
jgi:hypothetical protein